MGYTSKHASSELSKAAAAAASSSPKPKSTVSKMKSSAKSGASSSTKKPAGSSAKDATKSSTKEAGRRGRIHASAKYKTMSKKDEGINITAYSAKGVAEKAKPPTKRLMRTIRKMPSNPSQSKPYK